MHTILFFVGLFYLMYGHMLVPHVLYLLPEITATNLAGRMEHCIWQPEGGTTQARIAFPHVSKNRTMKNKTVLIKHSRGTHVTTALMAGNPLPAADVNRKVMNSKMTTKILVNPC
jgi:hypothetical protein